jgi:hypothetical protein
MMRLSLKSEISRCTSTENREILNTRIIFYMRRLICTYISYFSIFSFYARATSRDSLTNSSDPEVSVILIALQNRNAILILKTCHHSRLKPRSHVR